jgi:hypothetical protein
MTRALPQGSPEGPSAGQRSDDRSQARWLGAWLCLGIAAGALGVLLLGWIGGIDHARRIRPDMPAMVPMTAICFLLLAAALPLAREAGVARRRIGSALAFGALGAAGLGAIWRTILPEASVPGTVVGDDRMAYATALALALIACCVILIGAGRKQLALFFALPGFTGLGGLALLGWLGVLPIYDFPAFSGISLLSELFGVALLGAVLLSLDGNRPDQDELRAFETDKD